MSTYILIIFLIAFYADNAAATDQCLFSQPSDEITRSHHAPNCTNCDPRTKYPDVFFLTLPRSGSSVVGEIFLQNEDYVYLFEPTKGYEKNLTGQHCETEIPPNIQNAMIAAYNCNFKPIRDQAVADYAANRRFMYDWWHFTRFSSKNFWSCFDEKSMLKNNPPKSIAIKEISGIGWTPKIKWLYEHVGHPLRVLWLVRDVRGWTSTWLKDNNRLYKEWGIDKTNLWEPFSGCNQFLGSDMFREGEIDKLSSYMQDLKAPSHLRLASWWIMETRAERYYLSQIPTKAYMLLQYEHLAVDPILTVQQLFHFLGQKAVPESILRWLVASTQGTDSGDRYATSKNSVLMATIYKERLSAAQISDIESLAVRDFEFFSFQFVAND